MRRGYDAVVIGGGAVGLAIARRLARSGRGVAVLERDAAGGAVASRAAAGLLAPQAEARAPDAFFELALAARRRFPGFARALEEETGRSLGYRRDGLLAFALEREAESEIARRAEWQRAAGLAVEELTRAEVAARWPGLGLPPTGEGSEALRFAEGRLFYFPEEAQVDGGRMMDALLESCAAAQVDVLRGEEARGFSLDGDRVRGVRLREREVGCEIAINAAGAWAGGVAGWVGEALPVEPVRGEMLAYATRLGPRRPVLTAGGAYCLLQEGGRLLVGATVERVGFRAAITQEGQAWLERKAAALCPEVAGREPSARWAGLRPGTPDDLPVLGFSNEVRGLYHAAGHFRNGILLAPITAELVGGTLEGDASASAATAAFAPRRFAARAGAVE
jgi:glycine oxidase